MMLDQGKLTKDSEHLQRAKLTVIVDHGRAGNMFFMRLFDQHPEMLVCGPVEYFYTSILAFFKGQETVPGQEAYHWLAHESNFNVLTLEVNEQIRADLIKMGENPDLIIDRSMVREILDILLTQKEIVTRKEVFAAMHVAYAHATKRDVQQFAHILVNDSMTDDTDRSTFGVLQKDFAEVKIIHLVRDPRANFASLKHQYVNAYGTMYPLRPSRILKSLPSNCIWLWVMYYTIYGAREMYKLQDSLEDSSFKIVRIEDVNSKFLETMKEITSWIGLSIFEGWNDPDYFTTSVGSPWRGISAYKSYYQTNKVGPLQNDSAAAEKGWAKPNPKLEKAWRKRLSTWEVKTLEGVYFEEILDLGYELFYTKSQGQRFRSLAWALLPIGGEIPRKEWYFQLRPHKKFKDLIIKLTYPPILLLSYIFARLQLLILYSFGKLSIKSNG